MIKWPRASVENVFIVFIVFVVMVVMLGSIPQLHAATVPPGYRAIATAQGVPAELLYAVALTESGQSSLSHQQLRPWPWTLNVKGKGQYFSTRKDAWLALQRALATEKPAVDIGLMQISWHHHQQALGSAWQALDPYHNLRVGAVILQQCYTSTGDWWDSVGCYHAPNNASRAAAYRDRVKRHWQRLNTSPLP